MRLTKQTVLHAPEKGEHGNCFSAVLATLLHLPIENIPVWTAPYPQWQQEVNAWLRPYGIAYMQVSDFAAYCETVGITGCHTELGGTSPRNANVEHAMVAIDGVPVFDPHPSDAGVSEIHAAGVFILLKPWLIIPDLLRRD